MERREFITLLRGAAAALPFGPALAEKRYGPGVTDTEIKLGQTMSYSGPASGFGAVGLTMVAYLKMINDRGGIRGRTLNLISLDDGYSPPTSAGLWRLHGAPAPSYKGGAICHKAPGRRPATCDDDHVIHRHLAFP
jgi:hypothetical protein